LENEEMKTPDTGQDEKQNEPKTAEEKQPAEKEAALEQNKAAADAEQKEKTEEKDSSVKNGEKADAKPEKDGSLFGHKKKEDRQVSELKEKNEALSDQVKRQMAEFDNYRKRTEKEKEQMFSMGEKSVAEKILPIIDNFERGLAAVPEEEKDSVFVEGMQKVYRQMIDQMAAIGVTPIEAVGKDFNPDFHSAVTQVDSEEYETGQVAQELQKGYMYHDTVLRHTMVGVAK
jgi:molecular chaperone GrpE